MRIFYWGRSRGCRVSETTIKRWIEISVYLAPSCVHGTPIWKNRVEFVSMCVKL